MVSIALEMVIRVSAAFWTSSLINSFFLKDAMSDGMTSQAMQQGGMGLILTTLILTAPPMAAMFFQGTLGSFMAYSQIGGGATGQPGPQGQPPGSYTPPAPQRSESQGVGGESGQFTRSTAPSIQPSGEGIANQSKLGAART